MDGKGKNYKGIWKNNFLDREGKIKLVNKNIIVEFKKRKIIEKKKLSHEEHHQSSRNINNNKNSTDLDKDHK